MANDKQCHDLKLTGISDNMIQDVDDDPFTPPFTLPLIFIYVRRAAPGILSAPDTALQLVHISRRMEFKNASAPT